MTTTAHSTYNSVYFILFKKKYFILRVSFVHIIMSMVIYFCLKEFSRAFVNIIVRARRAIKYGTRHGEKKKKNYNYCERVSYVHHLRYLACNIFLS